MAPPHPSYVYAQELLPLGHGYPIWHPEPLPPNHIVPERGDVGYIHQGHFRRLFNSTKQPDPGSSSFKYDVVEYDEQLHDDRVADLPADGVLTHGVRVQATRELAASEVDGTNEIVEYKFTCTNHTGAMLLLNRPAMSHSFLPNRVFPSYMKKNHSDWMKQAAAKGLDMTKLDIILLRGTVQTTPDWTVAAFQEREVGDSQKITGTVVSIADRGRSLSIQSKTTPGVDSRAGPLLRLPSWTAGAEGAAHDGDTEEDQCIFLPYYKAKYRIFPFSLLPRQIQAGGGPHHLPDVGRDGDTTPAVLASSAADYPYDENAIQVRGPVDILLDYIMESSDAEVAIASDADVNFLSVPAEEDLMRWLVRTKPEIEVDDGLGMLSLRVLVQRQRRAVIEHMLRPPQHVSEQTQQFPPLVASSSGFLNTQDDEDARAEGERQRSGIPQSLLGRGSCLLGKDAARRHVVPFDCYHLLLSEHDDRSSTITSVALSPCGNLAATGCNDKIVRIWNLKTGQLLQKWQWHEGVVSSVAFSSTGAQVASGSADTVIYIWDPTLPPGTNTPARLEGHKAGVSTVAYSPDGKRLASGSVDTTIRVWDATTHQSLFTLRGHATEIVHLAWTADNERVVTIANACGLIWNAFTGEQIAQMNGHGDAICSISVNHAGDRVVTGSEDHSARIWDTRTGQSLAVICEHAGPVCAAAWSPDDEEVVTGAYDSTLVASNASTGQCRRKLSQRLAIVDSVAYSKNGKFIASGTAGGRVKLWNWSDGSMVAEWSGHTDRCKKVEFINGDKDILTASDDGSLRIWSVTDVLRII
ncbi:WD40 repeat domain-containing protein [Phanerochaete sordida]|uniref:WD40 repeat domain-containing protein n=1 Tax=Phanerochaete sordida TaxID=48140 RepID=A0A9P3GM30_9APHY|nr:WD40 repeat domain-containing protein [Phanerochaete sordida]